MKIAISNVCLASARFVLIASLAVLLLCPQCQCKVPENAQSTQHYALSIIEKRNITEPELVKAIDKLTLPAQESPRFWSKIANDPSYSTFHRRYAVIELFRRHVHPGTRLSELGRMLDHPTWLQASDVEAVYIMGGMPPPVHNTMFEGLFDLAVLNGRMSDDNSCEPSWSIWFVVHGQIGDQDVRNFIMGQPGKSNLGFVAQIGYSYAGLLPSYTSDRTMLAPMYSPRNVKPAAHNVKSGLLGIISEKNITELELVKAIGKLTLPAQESPRFWSKIANDPSYSVFHRRYAVIELFRRHIHPGIQLCELARILDHPSWLIPEDIWEMGELPSLDTGFEILPLGALGADQRSLDTWHISLAVQGHVGGQDFRDLILGRAQRKGIGNAVLDGVQWDSAGLLPPYSANRTVL